MTLREAIEARHSVRAYKNQSLAEDVVKVLIHAKRGYEHRASSKTHIVTLRRN